MILGIDVGGTSIKFGIVSREGNVSHFKTFDTKKQIESEGFIPFLKCQIKNYLTNHSPIEGVGIGFPGLLTEDRKEVILLPNIPSVKSLPIISVLKEEFPNLQIRIENDAKCATLGELYFGSDKNLDNYLLITLGTGVGSGVVIDRRLFLGARGNGLELGHILINETSTLEKLIGLNDLIEYAKEQIKNNQIPTTLLVEGLSPKIIYEAALNNDTLAISIFKYLGKILGEGLVSAIRILDLNTIVLGGGISGAFEFIMPEIKNVLLKFLPPYYTEHLKIIKASLGNFAGVLGAASLIMDETLSKPTLKNA